MSRRCCTGSMGLGAASGAVRFSGPSRPSSSRPGGRGQAENCLHLCGTEADNDRSGAPGRAQCDVRGPPARLPPGAGHLGGGGEREGLFASSSEDGCLKVWDLEGEEIASTARAEGGATSLGFGFRHHVLSGARTAPSACGLWTLSLVHWSAGAQFHRFLPVSGVGLHDPREGAGRGRGGGGRFMGRLDCRWGEDGSFYVWSANGPEEKWELVKSGST